MFHSCGFGKFSLFFPVDAGTVVLSKTRIFRFSFQTLCFSYEMGHPQGAVVLSEEGLVLPLLGHLP